MVSITFNFIRIQLLRILPQMYFWQFYIFNSTIIHFANGIGMVISKLKNRFGSWHFNFIAGVLAYTKYPKDT